MSIRVGKTATAPAFPAAAHQSLEDTQLRRNVKHATDVIRAKRKKVVDEMPDWQQLRQAGHDIKDHTLRHLDYYLQQFEANCERAGGKVHWARDADEANGIILNLIRQYQGEEIIKVKTMTSDEIGLNRALEAAKIQPHETDLADMIVQLGEDEPSHIVVPALHKNRSEIREIFQEKMHLDHLGSQPTDLTDAARNYLREKFLRVKIGLSGANFAIAETGSVCVVESEGNGRMCVSLPDVLITLVGIEKVIPTFQDLEVYLQLLPRSATGERMNPYNSIWTGVHTGDGPQVFHVVLLDNGRTELLANARERETLDCIRCGACLNACPVYRETGGHAYGSIYSGPIGAILSPQLQSMEHSRSLPYASSLCGACYEVCPVKINIPEVLIHLRGRVVREDQSTLAGSLNPENIAMKFAANVFLNHRRYQAAQRLARFAQSPFTRKGMIGPLPGMLGGWTRFRDLREIPQHSFRDWWKSRKPQGGQKKVSAHHG
ncbi:MAG: LutB/LldF family L-lactate oxidation iron-sulfur protein [Acidobacteriaceae bacterium]